MHRRGAFRSAIAWLGLALVSASFIVLVLQSGSSVDRPDATAPAQSREPFALVVLDAGHGGADSGAIAGGICEKELTLDIARRVERLLKAHAVATLMTRASDTYISLAERAALANRTDDSILVSIHFNDGTRPLASGVETYFATEQTSARPPLASWLPFLRFASARDEQTNVESQSLAGFIQQELVRRTQALDRGTKAEQFYVLANVRRPAALVEGGFLTNPDEAGKLADGKYREQLANAIATGVLKYRAALRPRGAAE